MTIRFVPTTDPPGLEVADSIEQRRLRLSTDRCVEPASPTAEWEFPIDRACQISVEQLRLDHLCSVTIHDETGRTERSVNVGQFVELGPDPQYVALSGPIKLYCLIEGTGQVGVGLNSIQLSLEDATPLEVGARSLHDRPAHTVTTSTDPAEMMQAVSVCSSSLKTTSPERTWPTLRGHPPLLELGETLRIPDDLEPAVPEIELVVPPTIQSVFQAAPLAFFLGARLRPGAEPQLVTPVFEHPLETGVAFADEVARLLKQFFLLDCLTRTEGVFEYDLIEREHLESVLPYDLAAVYDRPLLERLEQYLTVPFDELEPVLPRWPLTAYLPDEPAAVETLPFVLDQLGIVRTATAREIPGVSVSAVDETRFVRTTTSRRSQSVDQGERPLVEPLVVDDSVEHAWFGDGIPQTATKATIEAYRNQLDQRERSETIDLLVICNDARMIDEHDLLDDAYGDRERLPFEVTSQFGVGPDRLAALLTDGGYDFLHFIGHATPSGLQCPSGELDVRTLESVDLGVFFLNACQSYQQGLALTRRGAYGGVVTYADVLNETAVEAGETMARLLNGGFPLRAACEIAREESALGEQYLLVGDGSTDVAQTDSGAPCMTYIDDLSDNTVTFSYQSYSTKEYKLGSVTNSSLEGVRDEHLTLNRIPPTPVDRTALEAYFAQVTTPYRASDGIHWTDGIRFSF